MPPVSQWRKKLIFRNFIDNILHIIYNLEKAFINYTSRRLFSHTQKNRKECCHMYIGHFILLMILASVLLIAFFISQKKKKTFAYACWGISVIFFFVSLRYFYDIFIYNPTTEGYTITWSMYLLSQNEDFLFRNGKLFGLFWGTGTMIVSLILGIVNIKHHNINYNKIFKSKN